MGHSSKNLSFGASEELINNSTPTLRVSADVLKQNICTEINPLIGSSQVSSNTNSRPTSKRPKSQRRSSGTSQERSLRDEGSKLGKE